MMRLVGIVFLVCFGVALVAASAINIRLVHAQEQAPEMIVGILSSTLTAQVVMPGGMLGGTATITPGQRIVIRVEKK